MRNKKFAIPSHGNIFFELPDNRNTRYTRFMAILIIIAENPSVITRFFKNGTGSTTSLWAFEVFLTSIHLKKANNKKAILQINVNREKNKTTFMVSQQALLR